MPRWFRYIRFAITCATENFGNIRHCHAKYLTIHVNALLLRCCIAGSWPTVLLKLCSFPWYILHHNLESDSIISYDPGFNIFPIGSLEFPSHSGTWLGWMMDDGLMQNCEYLGRSELVRIVDSLRINNCTSFRGLVQGHNVVAHLPNSTKLFSLST